MTYGRPAQLMLNGHELKLLRHTPGGYYTHLIDPFARSDFFDGQRWAVAAEAGDE